MERKKPRRERAQLLRDLKAENKSNNKPVMQMIFAAVDKVMKEKRQARKQAQ